MMNFLLQLMNILTPLIRQFFDVEQPEKQNWHNEEEEPATAEPKFFGPMPGRRRVTSPYGWRRLMGKTHFHTGVDLGIGGENTESAIAIEAGVVTEILKPKKNAKARFEYRNGGWVDLNNGAITPRVCFKGTETGRIYKFKHCIPGIGITPGKAVQAGQKVGLFGNFGYSMGAHAHVEIWENGKHINPMPVLRGYGIEFEDDKEAAA